MHTSKGVSPLIASVLLIAFTMAIAAVFTGWLSGFTATQKEKNDEFEEKIMCTNGDMNHDPDFSEYDEASGLFKVRIINIGTQNVYVGKYKVWYENAASVIWKIPAPQNVSILKQDERILIVNVSDGVPDKIMFSGYGCDGVTTTVSKPLAGWRTGTLSSNSSAFVISEKDE